MCFSSNSVYADELPHMKVLVVLIQLVILMTNIPMLLSTLKYSLTMLDSLLVVSCINRLTDIATNPISIIDHNRRQPHKRPAL